MESLPLRAKYIETACPDCGIVRPVRKWTNPTGRCLSCAAKLVRESKLPNGCVRGETIGKARRSTYMLRPCPQCGTERWVRVGSTRDRESALKRVCWECAGVKQRNRAKSNVMERNGMWKGGRRKIPTGYILVKLHPNDFFYPMSKAAGHYILEHRLVMAKHLGRLLQTWETVHHKNGIKDDNRIENLQLGTENTHHKEHSMGYQHGYKQGFYDGKDKRIKDLQAEVARLKACTVE